MRGDIVDSSSVIPIVIRVATPSDAQPVARIYVDSWNVGFGDLMPARTYDDAQVRSWLHDLSAPRPQRSWVAEVQSTVVGFAGICPSRNPIDEVIGELDTIAVSPRCWRRGVGRALMAKALTFLETDGYREAILWTLAKYRRGELFYESTGWRADGKARQGGRQVCYRHLLRTSGGVPKDR